MKVWRTAYFDSLEGAYYGLDNDTLRARKHELRLLGDWWTKSGESGLKEALC